MAARTIKTYAARLSALLASPDTVEKATLLRTFAIRIGRISWSGSQAEAKRLGAQALAAANLIDTAVRS